jgi:hypothetical protein
MYPVKRYNKKVKCTGTSSQDRRILFVMFMIERSVWDSPAGKYNILSLA